MLTGRIVGNERALPGRVWSGGRRSLIIRVRSRIGIGIHKQHEFDVATGQKAVDVVVLKAVDFFEISTNTSDGSTVKPAPIRIAIASRTSLSRPTALLPPDLERHAQ